MFATLQNSVKEINLNEIICHTSVTYISILGWILDPLLFLLYIIYNDLYNVSKALDFIPLAEDTNIFFSRNDQNQLMEFVNDELKKLSSWFFLCVVFRFFRFFFFSFILALFFLTFSFSFLPLHVQPFLFLSYLMIIF